MTVNTAQASGTADHKEQHLLEEAVERLKEKGLRLTEQRQAVLDAVVDNRDQHLSCEDVVGIIKHSKPGIGQATVYRTLSLLEKMGLLFKSDLDDDCVRHYELCLQDEEAHCHLICLECGLVAEVKEDLLNTLEDRLHTKNDFVIVNRSLKFYGYCKQCAHQTGRE